ncbi:hypothetical protein BaRGS_00013922 [Batillaria attramentaria]|uniref:Uncharacterized protein n=1 Tax=Batillaria attramentaria TaxID=370345 RepID=A0ABD0L657_9CAEN
MKAWHDSDCVRHKCLVSVAKSQTCVKEDNLRTAKYEPSLMRITYLVFAGYHGAIVRGCLSQVSSVIQSGLCQGRGSSVDLPGLAREKIPFLLTRESNSGPGQRDSPTPLPLGNVLCVSRDFSLLETTVGVLLCKVSHQDARLEIRPSSLFYPLSLRRRPNTLISCLSLLALIATGQQL